MAKQSFCRMDQRRGRVGLWSWLAVVLLLAGGTRSRAQIDPEKRQLIQLGYNQPVQGKSPIAGYAFYYLNKPHFYRTNHTLRLALAPIYADAEYGVSEALGPNTDLGIGAAGGGFADSFSEIRQGKFERTESFIGHGGNVSGSVYHRFNPTSRIPLHGVLRGALRYATYETDKHTAPDFVLPDNQGSFHVRAGLRWGGREPLLFQEVAMEISAWYEAQFRSSPGRYGFNGDRELESDSHLFWARALLIYTLPELKHTFNVNLTLGSSIQTDRFSAYRLGGVLPLAAEFPLSLPGYYHQEISARRFVMLGANYIFPLDEKKRWSLIGQLTTAGVDYVGGMEQPGAWHSGVGGGVIYQSVAQTWKLLIGYAYGVDAIRTNGRGAHSIGFLLQFDLEQAMENFLEPGENFNRSRWMDRLLRFR